MMNIDTLQNNNSNNISMPMTSSNEIHINIDRLNILTNDENFNQESKQSQLEEIKEVLPYNDKESENEDAPQTKKLSKSVSKNSISSNKNIQKNNNYNFQSKIVSNSKSIEYSMQEDTLLQFLNHHQIQLIESNFNLLQKMNLSMNPLYEDVFYYGDVQKLNHCDDLSKVSSRKYVNRFCAMTKNIFKLYHTKEKFISLQNPIISIEIAKIKKVSVISFNTDKTVNDYTYKFSVKLKYLKKKNRTNFIIVYSDENNKDDYEIIASDNEEIVIRWVSLINYCIDQLNDI